MKKLLDLYCRAGGAAMGYAIASGEGFHITGIDIEPQPNYPFNFIQADAIEYLREHWMEYDVIHASPPCQHASTIAKQNRTMRPGKYDHPNLIPQTRELLVASGKPYIIENVKGAELINPCMLCGSYFGLDVRRHRIFETSFFVPSTPCCHSSQKPRFRSLDKRRKTLASVVGVHGHINYSGEFELRQKAMGIDWMTNEELVQAIPPAYTEYIAQFIK